MATPTSSTSEQPERRPHAKTDKAQIVVVDFGKSQRRRKVRRLRKGRGKLMTRIESIVSELVEAGTVPATAQPVVIVVRERKEMMSWPFGR
jgi:hypothetical protein